MKYTLNEFAEEIRKSYPGEYDDLKDKELVSLWLKKYPQDSKKVDFPGEQRIKSKSRTAGTQETIVYHRSNWVRQLLFGLALLFLFFISYLKNPTSDDFTKELEFKYNEKFKNELKQDGLVEGIFGMFSTALDFYLNSDYKRTDLLFFSIYHREVANTPKVIAIGFWDNFYFLEEPFSEISQKYENLDNVSGSNETLTQNPNFTPKIESIMKKYNGKLVKDEYGADVLRIDNYPGGGVMIYLDRPDGGRCKSLVSPYKTGTWSLSDLN
jgi:hypothetical protein